MDFLREQARCERRKGAKDQATYKLGAEEPLNFKFNNIFDGSGRFSVKISQLICTTSILFGNFFYHLNEHRASTLKEHEDGTMNSLLDDKFSLFCIFQIQGPLKCLQIH